MMLDLHTPAKFTSAKLKTMVKGQAVHAAEEYLQVLFEKFGKLINMTLLHHVRCMHECCLLCTAAHTSAHGVGNMIPLA